MNPILEKLVVLHELDLKIQQFVTRLGTIAVEREQIEEQLQRFSTSYNEAKERFEDARKDRYKVKEDECSAALQKIDSTRREISQFETEILARMGGLDVLKKQSIEIDGQLKALKKRRRAVTDSLPKAVLGIYERIKSRIDVALAEVSGNCCQECHMMIRYPILKKVHKGEQIMMCESCGRILYCKPIDSS